MHYKTITLLIFVVLMLLTMTLIFSDKSPGLLIIGAVVPFLVVVQVMVVLVAKDPGAKEQADGQYDHD